MKKKCSKMDVVVLSSLLLPVSMFWFAWYDLVQVL